MAFQRNYTHLCAMKESCNMMSLVFHSISRSLVLNQYLKVEIWSGKTTKCEHEVIFMWISFVLHQMLSFVPPPVLVISASFSWKKKGGGYYKLVGHSNTGLWNCGVGIMSKVKLSYQFGLSCTFTLPWRLLCPTRELHLVSDYLRACSW